MKAFDSIRKDIQNKQFSPIYLLYGEESFFIDEITKSLQTHVLSEDEKAFNEHIYYGTDTDIGQIISQAKQFPMMAERQLIVVKEAQHLSKSLTRLSDYAAQPVPSTILVINYKYGKPDGRAAWVKNVKKIGVCEESKKLYSNQIPDWISNCAKNAGMQINPKATFLMAEFIGDDLSRIQNEMDKLNVVLEAPKIISPEVIEKHIGISKDYNNFELTAAFAGNDMKKAFTIIKYFGENPKDNSIFSTLAVLFNFFTKLMIYQTLKDKSRSNVAAKLKVNPFFIKEYQMAAQVYPLRKTTQIISMLRDIDMKAKGVGATGNVTESELMTELVYKIFKA